MRSRSGFTLVEMLVAIFLASMVILGLAAVFTTVLKFELQGFQKDVIQGGMSASFSRLLADIRMTTTFDLPLPPCPSSVCSGSDQDNNVLRGCTNFDGIPGSMAMLNPSTSMRVYQYCVTSTSHGQMWYTWRESVSPMACPPTAVACGSAIAGGDVMMLARDVSVEPGYPAFFRRPRYLNNVVELHFVVGTGTATITVDTAVGALKTFNSLSP